MLLVDGAEVGELDYHASGPHRALPHVGVEPTHRGAGLAAKLTRRALDDARAEGVRVVPICPYVRAYLGRHPEFADVVADT